MIIKFVSGFFLLRFLSDFIVNCFPEQISTWIPWPSYDFFSVIQVCSQRSLALLRNPSLRLLLLLHYHCHRHHLSRSTSPFSPYSDSIDPASDSKGPILQSPSSGWTDRCPGAQGTCSLAASRPLAAPDTQAGQEGHYLAVTFLSASFAPLLLLRLLLSPRLLSDLPQKRPEVGQLPQLSLLRLHFIFLWEWHASDR